MKQLLILATALLTLAAADNAQAATYKVDPMHSHIGFSVRHLVGRVSGEFKDYSGDFNFDSKTGKLSEVKIDIKAASIDTGVAKRDDHLKSPDFFDVAKFPSLSATAGTVKANGKDKYKWTTDLTMHGVTKPVTFEVDFNGFAKDPYGNQRAGFQAKARLNRKDFGLKWNKAVETGGMMVGDDVDVTLDIEAIEQGPAAAKAEKPAAK
jgi:polyisoprenoid-binding protein YceI